MRDVSNKANHPTISLGLNHFDTFTKKTDLGKPKLFINTSLLGHLRVPIKSLYKIQALGPTLTKAPMKLD